MTRLLTRGFETGSLTTEVEQVFSTPLVNTGVPRTGTYKLFTNSANDVAQWSFSGSDTLYFGFGFYIDAAPTNNNQDFFRVGSGDSDISFRAQTNNSISVKRNGTTLETTGASIYNLNTWHYFEVFIFMANASGRVQILMDGVSIIDFTGDTLNGSDDQMDFVQLRGQQSIDIYFDDFVVNNDLGGVNDGLPGIISLEPVFPDSAGDSTELARGGTDSGANWNQVDEQPSATADYVFDTVVDEFDLYNLADFTLPAGAAIANVIVQGRMQIDSGSGSGRIMLKAGTTESEGPTETLSPGWALFEITRDVNPDDSAAWAEADIDALQIGMKVK